MFSTLSSLADRQTFDILTRFYLIMTILLAVSALLWFLLILAIKGDFEDEKVRLLLDVDPRVKTSSAFLRRGRELLEQKIWALAAFYLARSIQPGQLDGRAALAYACVKIKRYDLAQAVLAEAQHISPQDAGLGNPGNARSFTTKSFIIRTYSFELLTQLTMGFVAAALAQMAYKTHRSLL